MARRTSKRSHARWRRRADRAPAAAALGLGSLAGERTGETVKELKGRNALVTGGSGGIGAQVARTLAGAGMNVALAGRRDEALASVADGLRSVGVRAAAVPADLYERAQVEALVERAETALGPLDVLVNNAGVEQAGAFTRYEAHELTSMIELNLTAPLLLTHRVLPGMLERRRGHVVFISSMAGKLGPPYQVPYAAAKAGLIAITQSLRAEYLHAPVGFSVVCPGFVAGDGMYQRMAEQGMASNRMMGTTRIERVGEQVLIAIRRDRAELIESGRPMRPLLALGQLAPQLGERIVERIGLTELFRRAAAARGRAG
jgi:short-subunit dehydrogenase